MKQLLQSALAALCLSALTQAAFAAAAAGSPTRPKDTVVVDAKTEAVIKGGLKYLASKQQPSGAWGFSGEETKRQVAMTGYTLMAFQAAGHLPGEGEYGKHVTAGMNYLLASFLTLNIAINQFRLIRSLDDNLIGFIAFLHLILSPFR